MYFDAKRLALVVIERPKGIAYFYLSIGLTKKGYKTFYPRKPSIELWMLCRPLTPQLSGSIHHFLD